MARIDYAKAKARQHGAAAAAPDYEEDARTRRVKQAEREWRQGVHEIVTKCAQPCDDCGLTIRQGVRARWSPKRRIMVHETCRMPKRASRPARS